MNRRASLRLQRRESSWAVAPSALRQVAAALRKSAGLLAGSVVLAAAPAAAQSWTWVPSIAIQETLTNNVDLTPSDQRQGDLVTQITPALRISEKGARTQLDGFISLPVLLYARTGSENNTVAPTVDLRGDAQLIENFFHIEGVVLVSQQYFSAFGPQPVDLTNATQNRYQTATYAVNPYLKGTLARTVEYELRMNNIWANLSGAPINTDNSYTMEWIGKLSDTERRLGWRANFDIADTRFNSQQRIKSQLYRFEPLYNVDPQLRLSASGGYEENEYTLTSSTGPIYGVGFEWHPTPRTKVIGNWEHRYFGSSYLYSLDHRTPLSVWTLQFSRNVTTYPQQLFTLQAGVPLSQLLNNLFLSNIPDPAARQQAVDQFLQNRGLPATLGSPVNVYAQQILLEQLASGTVGLIGARNTLFLTLFNLRTEQITASGEAVPGFLAPQSNNTQTGGTLLLTHNLTPSMVLTSSLSANRTKSLPPYDITTDQGTVNVMLSSPLSARTKGFVGARYQIFNSSVANSDYREVAAFVGLTHNFR